MVAVGEPVAVVTGAASGIGREIVHQLARRHMRVVLTARNSANGEAARAAFAAQGLDIVFRVLDVPDPGQASALAQWLDREYGRLDILVNNAGVLLDPKGARVATIDVEVVRATLETNLVGPIIVTQALLPLLKKTGTGRIVNVSSALGQ